MVVNVDEILIAVFLTLSLILIAVWYVAILKWRKAYLAKILPCFKLKTKKIPLATHKLDNFKYPSIRVISNEANSHDNPEFVNINDAEIVKDKCLSEKLSSGYDEKAHKYEYKIDSDNNMIINPTTANDAATLNKTVSFKKDLEETIQENLRPINNMGSINQMINASNIREASFRKYNDMVVNQVNDCQEILRF